MQEYFVWGDLEESILTQAVQENKTVRQGLQSAAEALGTTFFICRNHWYKNVQKKVIKSESQENSVVIHEPEYIPPKQDTVNEMKESLEDFLGSLSRLVSENRRLSDENVDLRRENRLLRDENKDIKESYDYILKVIDRARRLCLEDDEKPERVKYSVGADGSVRTA